MRHKKRTWNSKRKKTGADRSDRNREIMIQTANQIKEMLDNEVIPWVRPWHSAGPLRNAFTGHRYGEWNSLLLTVACRRNNWGDARFLGFNQAHKLNGHVRKGEHGNRIAKIHVWKRKETFTDDDAVEEQTTSGTGDLT